MYVPELQEMKQLMMILMLVDLQVLLKTWPFRDWLLIIVTGLVRVLAHSLRLSWLSLMHSSQST